MLFRLLLSIAALFAAITPAYAQTNIAATLVAESVTPAGDGDVTLAIRMVPKPKWHGYWLNPGDAGASAKFDWSLPQGATISAPSYPVPQRLVIAELMNV